MKTTTSFLCSMSILLAGLAWIACSRGAPETPPPAASVANDALGIAIAAIPEPFVVTSNDGPSLELQATGETGVATLHIEATDELAGGINLVAEAESMQDWFEQQPDGKFFGNLELGTPHGPAFTSRGSYLEDGVAVEELWVFSLHPTSNRMLRLAYRYPPGEGKERLQELANALGEIEAYEAADN